MISEYLSQEQKDFYSCIYILILAAEKHPISQIDMIDVHPKEIIEI